MEMFSMKLSDGSTFVLESAIYTGYKNSKDVTEIVNTLLKKSKSFIVSNKFFGDIELGVIKRLIINNEYSFNEGEVVFLTTPKENLGIFYTNNNIRKEVIEHSINTISKNLANDMDMVTCTWSEISGNPFIELEAKYKSMSHLNICLQILQCLSYAKEIHNYKWVFFLEHDVLYPPNYGKLPDGDVEVYCNMNYIGLNKNGFQKLMRADKPLSQVCMKLEYAINHFQKIISKCMVDGINTVIEPIQIDINIRSTEIPSVHINHDKPFTGHYTIYGDVFTDNHDYWGSNLNHYS